MVLKVLEQPEGKISQALTKAEAGKLVAQISTHLREAVVKLRQLKAGQGEKALGYSSWSAMCDSGILGYSRVYIWKLFEMDELVNLVNIEGSPEQQKSIAGALVKYIPKKRGEQRKPVYRLATERARREHQLGKRKKADVTPADIRAEAAAYQELMATGGYCDIGDGTMTGYNARVDNEQYERVQRQNEHIRGGREYLLSEDVELHTENNQIHLVLPEVLPAGTVLGVRVWLKETAKATTDTA